MKGKVTCVILAAGLSKRFGSIKQLAKMDPHASLIQKALDTASSSKANYVMIVLGHSSSEIAAQTNMGRANLVYNKNFAEGLSSSVKCAIANISADSSAVLLMVADQPFVGREHLDEMIETFRSAKNKGIVALAFKDEPRNPVLLERRYFPEIERLDGDTGAKEIIRRHLGEVHLINIEDPKVFLDIDTREGLENAKSGTEHS